MLTVGMPTQGMLTQGMDTRTIVALLRVIGYIDFKLQPWVVK